jgi:hypothetical protein
MVLVWEFPARVGPVGRGCAGGVSPPCGISGKWSVMLPQFLGAWGLWVRDKR